MFMRSLLPLLVLAVFTAPAFGHDLLTVHEHTQCDTVAPFTWVELSPGETWRGSVDLSTCSEQDLGSYLFYGHINKGNRSPQIRVGDKIALKVDDLGTGEEFTSGTTSKKEREMVHLYLENPAQCTLSAFNAGRKAVMVRFTWVRVAR